MEKPTYTPKLGQPVAHQSKAVASGASQGALATWVHPHPQHHLSGLPCSSDCMATCIGGFWWFPNLSMLNQPSATTRRGVELSFNTQYLSNFTSSSLLVLFLFLQYFGASKSYSGGLGSLGERKLSMNTKRISSKVMLSYYKYSCSIELEYSFYIIIMT